MRAKQNLADSLVSTKLYPPTWDERAVQRLSLFAEIKEARKPALFSIVAPAGSGKSTLMTQLYRQMEAEGRRISWINLDQEDNTLFSFATYFMAALQNLETAPGQKGPTLEKNLAARGSDALSEVLLARVAKIRTPAAIFIDDFQNISDLDVLKFLDRLIAHMPEALCLVIGSRKQLPLELGRLRVSGRMCEVDQELLRFGSDEASDFLENTHGLELNISDLTALMEATEGWAAGLQLAALALHRHRGPAEQLIRDFSGKDRDLMSYLGESVLKSQPEGIRRFLLWTGPLRRLCPELSQAVSEHPKCGEMLTLLDRTKLFMVPLDRNGRWYRYHHLFGEFLTKLLQDSDPDRYRLICERAAQWCEANGLITEAIQYLLDIEQFERAADLIADHAFDVSIKDGDHYTYLDWMRRLPENYHLQRPEISLCRGWTLAFSRDPEFADSLAGKVLARLDKGKDSGWDLDDETRRTLKAVGDIVRAVSAGCIDDLEGCYERALPYSDETIEVHPALIGAAHNCVSYGLRGKGDQSGAAASSLQGIRFGQRSDSIYQTVWGHFMHGISLLEMGEVQQAREDGRQAQLIAESGESSKSFAISLAALLNAEIETTLGNFEAAKHLMEVGRTFALLFGPVEPLLSAFLNDARINAQLGNMHRALGRLKEGCEIANKSGYDRLFINLAIEEAKLLAFAGRPHEAEVSLVRSGVAERIDGQSSARKVRTMRIWLRLAEAEIQLASGKYSEALAALSKLQYSLGTAGPPRILMNLRCAKSIALWNLERVSESMRELDKALIPAAEQGWLYPILACEKAIRPVLESIRDHRGSTSVTGEASNVGIVQNLLALMSGEQSVAAEEQAVITPDEPSRADILTGREIELLRLAETGLTNKKLATQLLISEATVKWHMHNIYEKLNVGNRTAAAARARELRLI